MNEHHGVLTQHEGHRFAFHCCLDEPHPFSVIWNATGSTVSHLVFGSSAQVLERIIEHLTGGHSDSHTATVVAAARVQSGLTGDVVDGVQMLNEQLPYVTVAG